MLLVWSLQKLTFTSPDESHMNMLLNVHEPMYYIECDDCFPYLEFENVYDNTVYRYPGTFTKEAIELWQLNIPYLDYSDVEYMLDFQWKIGLEVLATVHDSAIERLQAL